MFSSVVYILPYVQCTSSILFKKLKKLFKILKILLTLYELGGIMRKIERKWGGQQMISYAKLWKRLIDENLTKTEFAAEIDISSATLAKMGKGEPVHLKYIERICSKFQCGIEDIIEYRP